MALLLRSIPRQRPHASDPTETMATTTKKKGNVLSVFPILLLLSVVPTVVGSPSIPFRSPPRHRELFPPSSGTRRSASVSAISSAAKVANSLPRGGSWKSWKSAEDLGRAWTSVRSAFQKRVVPVLRDPNGKVSRPLREYWEGRGVHGEEGAAANDIDLDGLSEAGMGGAARLVLLTVALSEALGFAGYMADRNGLPYKSRARAFLKRYDLGGKVRRAREGAERWWDEARSPAGILHGKTWGDRFILGEAFESDIVDPLRRRYRSLPERTTFAAGAVMGLTVSRSILSAAKATLVWGTVAFVAAEFICAFLGRHRGPIHDYRIQVRKVLKDPPSLVDKIFVLSDENSQLVTGLAMGTFFGFIL